MTQMLILTLATTGWAALILLAVALTGDTRRRNRAAPPVEHPRPRVWHMNVAEYDEKVGLENVVNLACRRDARSPDEVRRDLAPLGNVRPLGPKDAA